MLRQDICSQLASEYVAHLGGQFSTAEDDGACVIMTPFERPDGDYFALVVKQPTGGTIRITDDGDTLDYLYASGLSLSRNALRDVRRIASQYGVDMRVNELCVELDRPGDGPEAIHGLIQAVVNVARLVERRRPYTRLRFDEEVEAVIITNGVSYDSRHRIQGVRESHTIRFHVDSGRHLLIQPLTQNSEGTAYATAERWFYRFTDIVEASTIWRPLVMLDDRARREAVWTPAARKPLEGLVTLVAWSERDRLNEALLTVAT